jgi:hypothetical protein
LDYYQEKAIILKRNEPKAVMGTSPRNTLPFGNKNPGPGSYSARGMGQDKKGTTFTGKRQSLMSSEGPGPAQYS